jgi:hypothetical protein
MPDNHFQLHAASPDDPSHPIEVTVTGEVDAANAAAFTRAVRELPGPRPLIVNLSAAFYFDSAGFAALDRLRADNSIILVIEPRSALFAAAELICMPAHRSGADARQALGQRS